MRVSHGMTGTLTTSTTKEVSVRALRKVPYWYIICKPADGATTSQVFMRAKLTYYTELSERNQEIDYS